MSEGELGTCLPFLLEAGYSARSAEDRTAMMESFAALPHVPITAEIERRTRDAQKDLAKVGHHRLPPADLILAACAEAAGAEVLHYDRDYDLIEQRTSLQIHSVWLAPPGAL